MARFNLVITHDKPMQKLKKHWFGIDETTDVIAFPSKNMKTEGKRMVVGAEEDFAGEIVVNEDQVQRNAEEYGVSFEQEMARVVAHGVLHLYGYEDDTEEGKSAMHAIEDDVVSSVAENE